MFAIYFLTSVHYRHQSWIAKITNPPPRYPMEAIRIIYKPQQIHIYSPAET